MPSRAAIESIDARARAARATARRRVAEAVDAAVAGREVDTDAVVGGLLDRARLTINFHPDRIDRTGRTVIEGLLADRRYRSQFATGISNGSRSALAGGQRIEFERALFGDLGPIPVSERAIYGTLDITHDPHGGAPSFGSCALVLHDSVKQRCTFSAGDSHLGPRDVGTAVSFDAIAAATLEGAIARNLSVADLLAIVSDGPPPCPPARDLSNYVEAQIHGEIDLATEATALLIDPAFRGTPVARHCNALGDRLGIELRWHGGSVATHDDIPADFHGRAAVALAQQVARPDGSLTAREIGEYAATIPWEAQRFDGDPRDHPLQTVKYLWQGLLVWGRNLE